MIQINNLLISGGDVRSGCRINDARSLFGEVTYLFNTSVRASPTANSTISASTAGAAFR